MLGAPERAVDLSAGGRLGPGVSPLGECRNGDGDGEGRGDGRQREEWECTGAA
jgi:hypothetical protein